VYGSGGANTIWKEGLPIVSGDKVTVQVFIATGPGQLETVRVKLDGKVIGQQLSSPWSTVVDSSSLSLGYHLIEVWAQDRSARVASATKSLSFFECSLQQYADTFLPVTKSDSQQIPVAQMSIQGTVDPSDPMPSDSSVPSFIGNSQLDNRALVSVSLQEDAVHRLLRNADHVTLPSKSTLTVSRTVQSTATDFYYALVRDSRLTYTSPQPLDLSLYHVELQAKTQTLPGLLPGTAQLIVWGIDAEGKHGPPVTIEIDVPAESGSDNAN
jgi:hypothetical protein